MVRQDADMEIILIRREIVFATGMLHTETGNNFLTVKGVFRQSVWQVSHIAIAPKEAACSDGSQPVSIPGRRRIRVKLNH